MTATTTEPRPMTLAEITRRVPSPLRGGTLTRQSVRRWVHSGLKAPNGERVKLRANYVLGRLVIDQGDLDEFFTRLAGEPGE